MLLSVFPGGRAYSNAHFGAGSGPIFLDDVQCTSSASQLLECYSKPILSHNCLHAADAGVECEGVLAMKLSFSQHFEVVYWVSHLSLVLAIPKRKYENMKKAKWHDDTAKNSAYVNRSPKYMQREARCFYKASILLHKHQCSDWLPLNWQLSYIYNITLDGNDFQVNSAVLHIYTWY